MKKRFAALVLVIALLLTGCSFSETMQKFASVYGTAVPYGQMEYTRPDPDALEASVDVCLDLAETTDSMDALMDAVYDFYDTYDGFYTNYVLSDIRYSSNLTDAYWEKEYNFCAEAEPTVDAAIERLFCGLANSPFREELEAGDFFGPGFFDGYEEEPSLDEALVALMEQEAALEAQYYTLSDRYADADYTLDDALFEEMVTLYLQLIRVRQEIADYLGYPDYPSLAYDMYYYRDYTPQQAVTYLHQIGEALYDPYVALMDSDIWEESYGYCTEAETFRYMQKAADAMGGTVADAFRYLDQYDLCDIYYSANKLDSSFETYIWNYYAPFVFMKPYLDQSDKLTFAHEFGHFTADYACNGTFAGTDVAEIHSQAMEYLTLCYSKDVEVLTRYKLADSLCDYMEQSAYSLFEHQVYNLKGDALTQENVTALYEEVGRQFGFDVMEWDPRDFVAVLHFFTDPMYTVSYVVSNDLALQFYQMELEESGAGLALYEQILTSQDSYILTFAEEYGLESPFSESRLQEVSKFFETISI